MYALYQAIRTKKELEDPLFELRVNKHAMKYSMEYGRLPPDHIMPDIYAKVRKELAEERRRED